MPANCSANVQAIIAYIDELFTGGYTIAIQASKESFHMGGVDHLDDVAAAHMLTFTNDKIPSLYHLVQSDLFAWQALNVTTLGRQFYDFFNALEVKDGVPAPASGWGLDHALSAWGSYC